ncbi:hypothetical protein GpartN1_g681.t1 [Galdieria partita]|uniref:RED-like N-terminal domain-containing protein n=1 Tax=Galdieria partita TaxID=83374 RepID=A0A9C7UML4_9RHOD|nr:hypothetical protein GpartN1_g681.t1 [Galdieria partita]
MNRSSHQRPVGKKLQGSKTSAQKDQSKPDLSTIEGSRQFILQQDKKKRKKTHGIQSTVDPAPLQTRTEEVTPTRQYRDRAQERRESTETNHHGENETLVIDQRSRESLEYIPRVKGLDYSLLSRNTQQTNRCDTQGNPSEIPVPKQGFENISAEEEWPSLVAQIAVSQFWKEERPTPTGNHRVYNFYPGRMYYVYDLVKQGMNESAQPVVVRQSKKHMSSSSSITFDWTCDITSLIWAKDATDELSSFKEDCSSYNNGNPEIHLVWNCNRPSKHEISSTVRTENDTSKWSSVRQDTASTAVIDNEGTEENLHHLVNQQESEVVEEEVDIFQDIDATQVSWSYSTT